MGPIRVIAGVVACVAAAACAAHREVPLLGQPLLAPLPAVRPVPLRPVFLVAGQSNMEAGLIALEAAGAITLGHAAGARPLTYWGRFGDGWMRLEAAIRDRSDADAFVWFQGESDSLEHDDLNLNLPPTDPVVYREGLTDLIARVRQAAGRSDLPVLLTQISTLDPAFVSINGALAEVAATVPGTTLIRTSDLSWLDDRHLDATGLAAWAQRVLDAPRATTRGLRPNLLTIR